MSQISVGGLSDRPDSARRSSSIDEPAGQSVAAAGHGSAAAAAAAEGAFSDACRLARMALEVQELMVGYQAPDGAPLTVRVGLHCGEAVGGVVGEKMLRYHIFGPPLEGVNRMEQTCHVGGVRCSEAFAQVLRKNAAIPGEFVLDPAGEVQMEDGEMRPTYTLTFGRRSRRKNVVPSLSKAIRDTLNKEAACAACEVQGTPK